MSPKVVPVPLEGNLAVGKGHKNFYSLCPDILSPNLSQENNSLGEKENNLKCTKYS